MTLDKRFLQPRNARTGLAVADWPLLIAVALAQVMAAAALRAMSLSALRAGAARFRRPAQFAVQGSEARIVWAIEATGRRLGGVSTCLVRALVAYLVLGSRRRPLCLTIGVKRGSGGTLDAHAWVVCEGFVLIGGATSDDYMPLVRWTSLS